MSYPIRLALAVVAAVASVAGGTADGAEPVSTDTQVVTAAVSQDVINAEAVERREVDLGALARATQLSAQADQISQAASELQAQQQRKTQGYALTTTDPREIARQLMATTYGWGDAQFQCFDNIIMHESKWSITATNPSSGAYGIPQALPGSKMATAGADWKTNPATQITWALGYVKARYSTPCGAWSFKSAHGWY
ncbi:MAG TPA: lytic transglycosylase domain-containing protein [Propionibacteriaceae bacterium]